MQRRSDPTARTKVLVVFGTRPEAIKLCPLIQEFALRPDLIETRVCVSGQHREMLDQVLALFQVSADYDLNIMKHGQSLTNVTTAVMEGLVSVLAIEQPDWVIVQGDTTTAMAASLAAFYAGVSVGHVEAGLRTFDKRHPFPEEINRRVISMVADWHFAPTAWAANNLRREGVAEERIRVTGNTVIDALRTMATSPYEPSSEVLSSLPNDGTRLVLVTTHRRENHGSRLEEICAALRAVVESRVDVHVAFPVHPNPCVREVVHRVLGDLARVTLMPPLEYQELIWLMRRSYLVVTDSGGVQEEAPGLGKPVLVLRDTTERPEGVAAGTVRLVGADRRRITDSITQLLDDPTTYEAMAKAVNPYGDGSAGRRIADALLGWEDLAVDAHIGVTRMRPLDDAEEPGEIGLLKKGRENRMPAIHPPAMPNRSTASVDG